MNYVFTDSLKAASKSNAHVKNKLDDDTSLSDAIVELVCSLRVKYNPPFSYGSTLTCL